MLVGILAAGAAVALAQQGKPPEKPSESQAPATASSQMTPEDAQRRNPVKATPESLAQARRVYQYDCAMCHGEDGSGKGDLAQDMKLSLRDWREPASLANKTDGELFYTISNGKDHMMGTQDRHKPETRWSLVNLVRSFAKQQPGKPSNTPAPAKPKEEPPKQ
jgi:mono/diheme cytochrome c family protein